MQIRPLETKELPEALPLKKLVGPSFIILGLGLGSGEIILWPYLSSNFGLGIIWGAVLGLTFQFFMNMEIERYALAHGESIFVGFARKLKWLPIWFMLSTFLPWVWPGIAASSAKFVGSLFGLEDTKFLAIGFLVLMGIILTFGPVLYKTVETLQKTLIMIGVPSIFVLSIVLAGKADWTALSKGIVGIGEGYNFLPPGIAIASFLGALAYAGAGGNLNLAQSFYVKEKGYGMGKYSGRITNILLGKKEAVELEGNTFPLTGENLKRFRQWWQRINLEHATVFWLTGALTMLFLSLLAYATVYKNPGVETSINFVILEASVIAQKTFPFLGTFFLAMAAVMLFGTQFSVYGSNSRIAGENLVIANQNKFKIEGLPKYFYLFLWLQILAGVLIFALGFTEPLALVVLGAFFNAVSMFVYSGLVLRLNHSLEKPLRPSLIRSLVVLTAFLFYGIFSLFTIVQNLLRIYALFS